MAWPALLAALLVPAGAAAVEVDAGAHVSLMETGREQFLGRGSARAASARRLAATARHTVPEGSSRRAGLKARFPYYHSSREIRTEAKRLAGACGGRLEFRTVQDPEVSIDVIRVRDAAASPANRVFLMFGEHSRELISPESGLRLLKVLCGEKEAGGLDVSQILKDSEFEMVLNGNPRSRLKVEGGDFCLRANPDGVDLNRNWDEKWNKHTAISEANPGPKPFSEPETRIFRELVTEFRPTTFLTVHSGTRGLYMPYAYDDAHQARRNKLDMLSILKDIDSAHCKCPYGAAGKEVGYDCPGTCLDWVYDKLKAPYSFAFEIYTSPSEDVALRRRWDEKVKGGGFALMQQGESLAHPHFVDLFRHHASDFVQTASSVNSTLSTEAHQDPVVCFSTFNPDSQELYNETVNNWAIAYLELSQKVAAHIRRNASAH